MRASESIFPVQGQEDGNSGYQGHFRLTFSPLLRSLLGRISLLSPKRKLGEPCLLCPVPCPGWGAPGGRGMAAVLRAGPGRMMENVGCLRGLQELCLNGTQRLQKRRKSRKVQRQLHLQGPRDQQAALKILALLAALTLQAAEGHPTAQQERWAYIPETPWVRVVTWGERIPEPVLQNNITQLINQEFNFTTPAPNQKAKANLQFNFTGLAGQPPICITKNRLRDNSTCVRIVQVQYRIHYGIYASTGYWVHLETWGLKAEPWTNSVVRMMRREKCSVSPHLPGYHLPPPSFISCDTASGQFIKIHNLTLQSWHNVTYDNETYIQGFPSPNWVTQYGKTTPGLWKIVLAIGGKSNLTYEDRTSHYLPPGRRTYAGRVCLGNQYAFMWGRSNVTYNDSIGLYNITCNNCSVAECIGEETQSDVFIITRPRLALTPDETNGWYASRTDQIFKGREARI